MRREGIEKKKARCLKKKSDTLLNGNDCFILVVDYFYMEFSSIKENNIMCLFDKYISFIHGIVWSASQWLVLSDCLV